MKIFKSLALSILAASAFHTAMAADPAMSTASASVASADMTDGEVKKIDKSAGKITIKHGEIKNLDMPGMTMVFRIKDAAALDTLKAGDKVKFKVEKADGAMVVTAIQVVK
ncbi:copper-binding protein [Undibacterium sp. Jales W-56]|uniref:copper-binding protein n=1 Tax=Undibacterium sp. Jales W-56 TaxID=2897325 RepID=UPI0021D20BCD|nr:copper-binding protein [Undibacterium sp. Jales W-56]MCU6435069.1 copper-binding protein [Undibacterium sp. Jales W-56]